MELLRPEELRDLAHDAMARAARVGRDCLRDPGLALPDTLIRASQLLQASDIFHFHANLADPPKGSNDD